jgi:hypothetical protein
MNYRAAEARGISPFPALVYFLTQQERDCRRIGNLFYRICLIPKFVSGVEVSTAAELREY